MHLQLTVLCVALFTKYTNQTLDMHLSHTVNPTYISVLHSTDVWSEAAVCAGQDSLHVLHQLIQVHGKS